MAIQMLRAGGFDVARSFLDVNALAASEGRRALQCLCPECGVEVTYDSLIATCRCIDEFSVASERSGD